MAIQKLESTGIQKASKIAFNNTDKISRQGNKEKISGSIKDLKKVIVKKKADAAALKSVSPKKPTMPVKGNRSIVSNGRRISGVGGAGGFNISGGGSRPGQIK